MKKPLTALLCTLLIAGNASGASPEKPASTVSRQDLAHRAWEPQRPVKDTTMTLDELLQQNGITLEKVQQHLAALSGPERVRQATNLSRSNLAVLWTLAGTKPDPIRLEEFVPADATPLNPVPFEGQNSLLAFRSFKKVFYRTPDGKIAGYNDQAMGWLTGPGYYIVKDAQPDVFIDYTEVPTVKPADWPEIKPNESGLSTLVYGHMQDYMRRIYGKILIGRAVKKGEKTENYFVLARPE